MTQSIFAIIIVFGGLIFIHELGHFLIARLFNIGVRSFSIGFGPKLLAKTIGNTEYRLSAIPLGGYVALVGEEDNSELPEGFTAKDSFALRPAWQRFCVVIAGATFNIFLAIVIYCSIFYFAGKSYLLAQWPGSCCSGHSPGAAHRTFSGHHRSCRSGAGSFCCQTAA